MRSRGEHLSAQEVEALLAKREVPRVLEPSDLQDDLAEVEQHVERCDPCARSVSRQEKAQWLLAGMSQHPSIEDGADCTRPPEWIRLVEKDCEAEEADALLAHAARCDRCSVLLSVLYENESESESDHMNADASEADSPMGSPRTDGDLAREIVRRDDVDRTMRSWSSPRLWRAAAVAALVILGIGVFHWRSSSVAGVHRLLSIAYSEERVLELRFDSGQHAALQSTRGPGRTGESVALLEARARILEKLRSSPEDLDWLHARGKADLLRWNFEDAIVTLERVAAERPDAPDVQVDLAAAYFERAEAEERAIDYGRALDLLDDVVQGAPENLVALFNRAVVLEKLLLWHQAAEAWEAYLNLDPDGAWSREAQERLDAVRERIASAAQFHGGQDGLYRPSGDRAEELLQRALTDSLVTAVGGNALESPSAHDALTTLANQLSSQNADAWLEDFLKDASSAWFAEGARELSAAVSANARSDPDRGYAASLKAAAIFEEHGASAGAARALYEAVYALQRASRGADCLALLERLAPYLSSRYPWLTIQAALEEASCSNMTGALSRARSAAQKAFAQAERSGYGLLRLRAAGNLATQNAAIGDVERSWALNRRGLGLFWQGGYPPVRAYQFYYDLSLRAESLGLLRVARDLAAETVELGALTGNALWEAAARARSAELRVSLGHFDAATSEFDAARRLFELTPASEARRVNRLYAQAGIALVEARSGYPRKALSRLERIRGEVRTLSNQLIDERIHLAELESRHALGESEELEAALRDAVRVTTLRMQSLPTMAARLAFAPANATTYRRLVRVLLQRGDTRRAFELWQWYRAQLTGSVNRDSDSPSPAGASAIRATEKILSAVSEGEARLVYVVFPDGVQLWYYDRDAVASYWVPIPRATLARLVGHYARLCADPSSDLTRLDRVGRQLYELLLAPLESTISTRRRLLIQPDGELVDLPFESLVMGRAPFRARVGGIAFTLGGYRSAPERATPLADERLLSVAAPTLSESTMQRFGPLPPLPEARRESDRATRTMPAHVVLSGRDATSRAFDTEIRKASIVHFAGHAVTSAERNYLLLSGELPDALWTPSLLSPGELDACRLVVLSACSTDGPTDPTLGGPGRLVTGFLHAGVEQVLATRWRVDSGVTSEVVAEFFSRLEAGDDGPTALRHAVHAARASNAHPYFWAGFVIYVNT